MGMIDCGRCGEPVADDAANCPHCGAPVQTPTAPLWYQILIFATSVGMAGLLYALLDTARIGILGAVAGVALYSGAVWVITRALFGKRKR